MSAPRRSSEEQYQLIMECRSSGLSDYTWCQQHNINPGTFYNWVKRLREKACYEIPPATGRNQYAASPKQDIVPLEIIDDNIVETPATFLSGNAPLSSQTAPPLTIHFSNANISLQNDISHELLAQVFQFLGDRLC